MSSVDNVEHLFFELPETGNYSLRINRLAVTDSGADTQYGFAWSAESILLGDVNRDGVVSFLDIPSFISRLSTGDFLDEADIDGNGAVNFLDISSFIAIFVDQ